MGKKTFGLIVLFVVSVLFLASFPSGNIEAASKKSKKKIIVVTTQDELVAALKKYSSSNSGVKIKIETTEACTFTLNAKYSSASIQIVVDAPNATIKSKATVSSITINEAKAVKEYASGNRITVNDEKLTFTAMKDASVEKLTIASEVGTVKVVNNGGIEKVSVKSEVKIDLTQNGEVGHIYVGAAAAISISGTSEESLKVTVQKDAVKASVMSEVPVNVNAYADVDLTLEKGAESSKVTMKEETAGVKLENNTEKAVSVKDTEGKTRKVETGEDLTTDQFVGKPEEPDTTDSPVTEQTKEDDKKDDGTSEEKKEDDKPENNNDNDDNDDNNDNNRDGVINQEHKRPEWGSVEYRWSENNKTLTAIRPCINGVTANITETVGVDVEITNATCTEKGKIVYTSKKFTNNSDIFKQQTKTVETDALGHEWGAVTYIWSADNKSVTAKCICGNDNSHIETETVGVDVDVTNATCNEKGKIVYTSKVFTKNPDIFKQQTKTVETDTLGHKWGEVTYTWSADNKSVTAKRICGNDNSHIETETVGVDIEVTDATCTERGKIVYKSKAFTKYPDIFKQQTKTVETDVLGHDWGKVTYSWSADNKSVIAKRICGKNSSHIETETVGVDVEITNATCTGKGKIVYTSKAFTKYPYIFKQQTKTVETDVLGHDWGEVTYTWSADNKTVTAKRICGNDSSHIETETVDADVEITDATCTEKGKIVYTSKAFTKYPNIFMQQTKIIETDALGHDWGEVTYTWSENKKYVTAECKCVKDTSHVETETVEAVYKITIQPTCVDPGEITYTASFSNPHFGPWSKSEVISALGHDYSKTNYVMPKPVFEESAGNDKYGKCLRWEKGKIIHVCANDSNHFITEEVKVPLALFYAGNGDDICVINGSNVTFRIDKMFEEYKVENPGVHSFVEAYGPKALEEYLGDLKVYPYNEELKEWWIMPNVVTDELVSLTTSLEEFLNDGIGDFTYENDTDQDIDIHDVQYFGENLTFAVRFIPEDTETYETLNISITFVLPPIEDKLDRTTD